MMFDQQATLPIILLLQGRRNRVTIFAYVISNTQKRSDEQIFLKYESH